jgi:hypothetical protein
MNKTLEHNYKNLFSKWLLAVVLLLSFFNFSGLVIQTQQKSNAPQTTLVQSDQGRIVKSLIYQRALIHKQNRLNPLSFFVISSVNLSEVHSRQVKSQITDCNNLNMSCAQTCFFYQHKTIPQNTSDDPAIALV